MRRAIVLVVAACLGVGCASRSSLVSNQTYYELEPVKALDIDQSLLPVNLIVRVHNVADMGPSYKSRFELKVNGRRIEPVTEASNIQSDYEYQLKLKPGYYEVRGTYFASGGWQEERAEVRTRDLVRVEPGRRTVLEVSIRKNWDGTPVDKVMFFDVSYQPLAEVGAGAVGTAPPTAQTPQGEALSGERAIGVSVPGGVQYSRPAGQPFLRNRPVLVQINTDPEHCDVIVDDQAVGQSPLQIWIDSSTSHVIQISRPGYRTTIRYLDASRLAGEEKMVLIERLEKE
ncbi:MAG: PEGA domain-containing protein [candidate division KSB1 bacterium]|nr:PEGA domain-containing protein [candidate division KSB1 bacterium]